MSSEKNDSLRAPMTRAFLLNRLNTLEKSNNELRYKEEKLAKEIQKLESERKYLCSLLAPQLEEKNYLLKLYQELGGSEWEIVG